VRAFASRHCNHSSISCCAPGHVVTHQYSCDPRRPMLPILVTPFSARRRAFSRAVATRDPSHGAVTMPHAEPFTAGKLPKDSGVDGRRGGTYLLPSRGGDTPRGREATRCGTADAMRCAVTACGRGGTVTLGTPRGTCHDG